MKKRPFTTILISTLSVIVTLMTPLFDRSIYAIDSSSISWLGFNPALPFRHMGIGLISSPFMHVSAEHLLVNLFFFIPVAMMIERVKGRSYLLVLFLSIHFLVLISLILTDQYYPLSAKSFLGCSHVVVGLYAFWFLKNKNYALFTITVATMAAGLWQSQSPLTTFAHGLGLLVGISVLIISRLTIILRPKRSN